MRLAKVVASAAVAALLSAGTALAAPDNDNVFTQPVTCEAPLAAVTGVSFVGGASSSGFILDGQVVVAKAFSFDGTITFTIDGLAPVTIPDVGTEGGNGQGYQDRLVECTFENSFEDEFTLTKRDAAGLGAFLGIDLTPYIGETVLVSGEGVGTASVFVPGDL